MESYSLFLIIPPGLEDLALRELELKCPIKDVTPVKGGLELTADLEWIERAHTLLKIPTRILLRLTDFKVRDFPKLYQKFSHFKWNDYLAHPFPEFSITCTNSRLNHTGRIEETIKSALTESLRKQPLSKNWEKKNYSPQTFYIRLMDDHLTMSLDLSGEPLYKRGFQTIKGEAPLRENFAAAFAFEILDGLKDVTLVDPMCGSGTLLTEALTFHQPMHFRKFHFEEAPFYKGKILKIKDGIGPLSIMAALGIDLNQDLIKKVNQEIQGKTPITFTCHDSLKMKLPQDNLVILCNPPYGERIKIAGKRGSFLKEAWLKFLNEDKPLRFGWVLPSDMDDLFQHPEGYSVLQKRHLRNGGMAVTFWIWERASY